MTGHQRQPWFHTVQDRAPQTRFCVLYPGRSPLRGQVVLAPPFAEELNKCRRMIRLQAEALAAAGFDVLVMDLLGTGDSPGEFGDASWNRWRDDLLAAVAHVRSTRKESLPLWLWGVRAGCALAAACARALDQDCRLLFWQPLAAPQQLQQWLRWAKVGTLLSGTSAASGAEAQTPQQRLDRGDPVDIGGYELSAVLAREMAADGFEPPGRLQALVWMEVCSPEPVPPPPWVVAQQSRWSGQVAEARLLQVEGPAFWSTVETEDAPLLVDATLRALESVADRMAVATGASTQAAMEGNAHA
ncbi:MAG: hydrolase 2, exosortase A system-associated [Paucibacter sp.]|nr:hydrolase 2, exosortase A system-associated [Roseateles sp.]